MLIKSFTIQQPSFNVVDIASGNYIVHIKTGDAEAKQKLSII